MGTLLGSVEAGGTKIRYAVGTGPAEVRAEVRLETRAPRETLAAYVVPPALGDLAGLAGVFVLAEGALVG